MFLEFVQGSPLESLVSLFFFYYVPGNYLQSLDLGKGSLVPSYNK